MAAVSSNLLLFAFVAYLVATFMFGGALKDKGQTSSRWGTIGISLSMIGFFAQLGYFITRWIAAGHAPVSNLFEFITFFSMALVFSFIIFYFIYRSAFIGMFALPIAVIIIAYASVFPRDIQPLVPSLQSHWLQIHVTTAALGEAILAISFVVGLVYLLKTIDFSRGSKKTFWMELVLYFMLAVVGFVGVSTAFSASGYSVTYEWANPAGKTKVENLTYTMPVLVAPHGGKKIAGDHWVSNIELPERLNAKKTNSVLWGALTGALVYGAIRLFTRKRLGALLQPLVKNANTELLDEIGYRAVAVGFPVFSLGALIFAMIWAQYAWSRFWGWDPKEVWALITFLFYAAYLHLRL
ncbi:MAG: c-type cytochrome biogenesis protein CcsB, partial [Bacilli bacterium]